MSVVTHSAVQFDALPVRKLSVQASLSVQSDADGQFPSHVSFASTTLFPQVAEQSLSFDELHVEGQHPSLSTQAVIGS